MTDPTAPVQAPEGMVTAQMVREAARDKGGYVSVEFATAIAAHLSARIASPSEGRLPRSAALDLLAGGQTIYVRMSDDGANVRCWDYKPFQGAVEYRPRTDAQAFAAGRAEGIEDGAMPFRDWLAFSLHAARYNNDAYDAKAAEVLDAVLKRYDASVPA